MGSSSAGPLSQRINVATETITVLVARRVETRRHTPVHWVVVPVPDGVLVQPCRCLALTHVCMESLTKVIGEQPLDLLLVLVRRCVKVHGFSAKPTASGSYVAAS